MHLYPPHISIVLLLITIAAIVMQGGLPVSWRSSRALQALGVVWASWILYMLTQQFIR